MNRKIYLLINDDDKIKSLFKFIEQNNNNMLTYNRIHNNFFVIQESYPDKVTLFDYNHLFKQFLNSIRTDLSILIINDGITITDKQLAYTFLNNMYCNVYDISNLLYYCLIKNTNLNVISHFQHFLATLDYEVLETAYAYLDNNLNILQTSKNTYFHRNSINYRLAKFNFITGIDIKTTQGASIIQYFRVQKPNLYFK